MLILPEIVDLSKQAKGRAAFFSFNERSKAIKQYIHKNNQILYSGADILANLVAGTPEYKISAMYFEFKNLGSSGDPITPPAFDRTGGIAYYMGLSSSPDVDFLRVPLTINPAITSQAGAYVGNIATFFSITDGLTGFNGKPFNSGVNSAVYGAALVATPDPADQTKDVVFSRIYTGIDKILKETGFGIGVTWPIQFN
jgi:hypothetical protein